MSDEKQCPLKAGQSVTVCARERCAWWDGDREFMCCVLMSLVLQLGHLTRPLRKTWRVDE